MTPDAAMSLTRSLAIELAADRPQLRRLDDYHAGRHPLAFASKKFLEAFGGLFKAAAVNWCPLVIAATLERLHVEGFRNSKDETANARPWEIWQANNFDAGSNMLFREALKYGRCYTMAGPGDDGDPPLLTIESPLDVIHRMSTANRRRMASALRVFTDDDGTRCATLYLPDEIWRWQRAGTYAATRSPLTGRPDLTDDLSQATWEPRVIDGRDWPEVNDLGVVPIVAFLASPELDGWGTSELAAVLPLQDMVNKTVADMLVASEFVAMPQRFATGMEIQVNPTTNQPVDPFPVVTRMYQAEAPETKFGQFPAADLSSYVQVLGTLKQDVATITRTPPHYFYLGGAFPSGEAIKSAEAGLVAKAKDRMLTFGESAEQLMRLALVIDGSADIAAVDMETVWGDPEYRIESEHIDATLKKQALGVPWLQLMEDAGYSPQVIERMTAQRDVERRQAAQEQADAAKQAADLAAASASNLQAASQLVPPAQRPPPPVAKAPAVPVPPR